MKEEILRPERITATIDLLCTRIQERFPERSLYSVGRKLHGIAMESDHVTKWIQKPNLYYRVSVGLFVILLVVVFSYAVVTLDIPVEKKYTLGYFITVAESAINEVIMLGVVFIFLVSVETRTKRRKVIASINKLRSIAHIIDAHQLTKAPISLKNRAGSTAHSPERDLTESELDRYLDYCSEMLSLTSKVGYLYVQGFSDPLSVNAVNDLEQLTTGLSRKIWQKIMMLRNQQKNSEPATGRKGIS